jgi:hypothetical protein
VKTQRFVVLMGYVEYPGSSIDTSQSTFRVCRGQVTDLCAALSMGYTMRSRMRLSREGRE